MSEAWNNAKKHIDSLSGYPYIVKSSELKTDRFVQKDFRVNFYIDGRDPKNPERLGMISPPKRLEKEVYDKIVALAQEKNLNIDNKSWSSSVYLLDSRDVIVAELDNLSFTTTTPELFQEIGEKVYGMKAEKDTSNTKNIIYSSQP
jgi:hypothetical protein